MIDNVPILTRRIISLIGGFADGHLASSDRFELPLC